MRVAIVGSRRFGDLEAVAAYVANLPHGTIVISGGAQGVDSEAVRTAKALGMATEVYIPSWEAFGKAAGPIRNRAIVARCDRLVAFWDGQSTGTRHAFELARKLGKEVLVCTDE